MSSSVGYSYFFLEAARMARDLKSWLLPDLSAALWMRRAAALVIPLFFGMINSLIVVVEESDHARMNLSTLD